MNGRKFDSGMIQVDPLDCFQVGEREQAPQVRLNVMLVFRDCREAKRAAGRVNQHSLASQIQSFSVEADPMFHVVDSAQKMNQRFLIQSNPQKRAPIMQQIIQGFP